MKRVLNLPFIYLTLILIVLILLWSVIIRFPWIVGVAAFIYAAFLIFRDKQKAAS